MTLHDLARRIAEAKNPGGEHHVTSVEIDGPVGEPGFVTINVATRALPSIETVDIKVRALIDP